MIQLVTFLCLQLVYFRVETVVGFQNVNHLLTLVYLIAEQAVISKQDGSFQIIVKRAGHNKQAGWNILEYLISEQAEFH